MSLRKQHRKRIEPILDIIRCAIEQTPKQNALQEQVNRGIVEQLIQTDVIQKIHSGRSLRLIIYELILLLSQQRLENQSSRVNQSSISFSRISQILISIKLLFEEILQGQLSKDFILNERQSGRENMSNERTFRNKLRIFTTYYKQYCNMIEEIDLNLSTDKIEETKTQKDNEVLIDQLENLIFKKETRINQLQKEKQTYLNQIQSLHDKIEEFKKKSSQFRQYKTLLQDQNGRLKLELSEIANKQTEEQTIISQPYMDTMKYIWKGDSQKTVKSKDNNRQNELTMCLLSQALTIQALLQ